MQDAVAVSPARYKTCVTVNQEGPSPLGNRTGTRPRPRILGALPVRRCCAAVFAMALGGAFSGCATFRPESGSAEAISIAKLVGPIEVAQSEREKRNSWIQSNVIAIDQDFDQLRLSLQAWRSRSAIATKAAALLANVASSLTQSAGVKANYVAISTIASGAGSIVDSEKLMEQTVATLVDAMEARRATAYARLRIGMPRSIELYNMADAHRDVLAYAAAGRIEQGMSFAANATAQAARVARSEADEAISLVTDYTEDVRQLTYCATQSLASLDHAQTQALVSVMREVGVQPQDSATLEQLLRQLNAARINATAEFQRDVYDALEKYDLRLDPCPTY